MSDQLYANGRISVMSNRLLTLDKFTRLAECSCVAEALKVLSECGYGDGVAVQNPNNYENMLNAELDSAMSVLSELCCDKKALEYFLCRYNYHNAKVLMKNKYMRTGNTNGCFNNAGIAPDKLQKAFVEDDYSLCTKIMAEACDKVDTEFANGNRSPRVVDVVLDKAMYCEMRALSKCTLAALPRKLYVYEADTVNLMLLYRLKKAAFGVEALADWMVEGGLLKKSLLEKLWEKDSASEELSENYRDFYALCTVDGNANLMAAEAAQRAGRNKILMENADMLSIQPVVSYFFNKVDEIDKVRFVLICIKNGTDKEVIKNSVK